ncbi:hypothetical protein DdX_12960 [Ditylenchus destructor]|uniref:Uncharacterized protein n=1 Tax=Ditylenchus destructor TaxID=166010 RepID=A0AAD4MXK5_9BILA|nr:hypothetical protein DdX_12960 [Ditylenchus destructor]
MVPIIPISTFLLATAITGTLSRVFPLPSSPFPLVNVSDCSRSEPSGPCPCAPACGDLACCACAYACWVTDYRCADKCRGDIQCISGCTAELGKCAQQCICARISHRPGGLTRLKKVHTKKLQNCLYLANLRNKCVRKYYAEFCVESES